MIKYTDELKRKMSEAQKKSYRDGVRKPVRYWKGKHCSEEIKQKISKKLTGVKLSEETRKNISLGHMGGKGYGKDKKLPKNVIEKRTKTYKANAHNHKKVDRNGSKNPAGKGGISYEPYSKDGTETLRISIRERDDYTCRVCGKKQGDITHEVHHIDYDKKNCDPKNLITLCRNCHRKTNHHREYWLQYFNKIIN